MRSPTRLGVAAAATVLTSATLCTGVGVAAAQEPLTSVEMATEAPRPTYTSNSTLSVTRSDGEPVVSYANRSGRDLFCLTILSTADIVDAYYHFLRTVPPNPEEIELPGELEEAVEAAVEAGRFGYVSFESAPGSRGPVDPVFAVLPEDASFALEAVSSCTGDGYVEIEKTTSGGYLGSLAPGSSDLASSSGEATGSLTLGAIASAGVGVGVGVATGVIPLPTF
ncbi:hypothetical protein ABIE38_003613 [Dietzia sp. 2505]|uniref:hypothetical protein n=1 Tax=Dietzia sp. 2505 TaxID=3156457 RepID=UPI003399C24B